MSLLSKDQTRMETQVQALKAAGQAFAMATVVRTLAATSAKPGDKAILSADGAVLEGWIGGGCARSAIRPTRPWPMRRRAECTASAFSPSVAQSSR
ncbi:MAG: XdhC family protein, partial [Pseudomonadota bacterium]